MEKLNITFLGTLSQPQRKTYDRWSMTYKDETKIVLSDKVQFNAYTAIEVINSINQNEFDTFTITYNK